MKQLEVTIAIPLPADVFEQATELSRLKTYMADVTTNLEKMCESFTATMRVINRRETKLPHVSDDVPAFPPTAAPVTAPPAAVAQVTPPVHASHSHPLNPLLPPQE